MGYSVADWTQRNHIFGQEREPGEKGMEATVLLSNGSALLGTNPNTGSDPQKDKRKLPTAALLLLPYWMIEVRRG